MSLSDSLTEYAEEYLKAKRFFDRIGYELVGDRKEKGKTLYLIRKRK